MIMKNILIILIVAAIAVGEISDSTCMKKIGKEKYELLYLRYRARLMNRELDSVLDYYKIRKLQPSDSENFF
jgi:hypothetical protein